MIKKIFSVTALSLSLAIASSAQAQAPAMAPMFAHPQMGGFAAHRQGMGLHHALQFLNLSAEQNDKIFEIRHKNEPNFYKSRQKVIEIQQQIDELKMSQNFDVTKARALYIQLANTKADIKIAEFSQDAEIYDVLTADQKAELKKLCDAAHQKHKNKPKHK